MEEKASICCYTPFDREFPQKLRDYSQMPEVLYVKGRLPNPKRKSVAIVGARVCSHYGAFWAYEFAKVLAEHGVQIISGLAKGIDSCAHKGALEAGGDTFAVLGCGVDVCYPRQNQDLYRRMVQGKGGILSEFEAGTPPYARNFPRRNRIISGLSDLILVIEAKKKSGSLITAGYGLEQGKTVFALPGRVGDALSEGCNQLLADGAGVADSVEAGLSELQIFDKKTGAGEKDFGQEKKIALASREEMVYSCLDLHPKNIEDIVREIPLSPREITGLLLKLELKGLIEEPVKNYYARTGG